MARKRPEKKSETLEVRLPHSKKQAFMRACEREGITASHAVRTFIDAYTKRSRRVKLKQITQELIMTLFKNPLKTTGSIGATVTAAILLAATPGTADDRNALPIWAPLITYPSNMAEQGITGWCEAIFNVSKDGIPENINAECTHPGFVKVVMESASTLRFEPKIKNGQPVRRKGVVYPVRFEIDQEAGDKSLAENFAELDTSKDGYLTTADKMGQGFLDTMDQNNDGKASFAEYKAYTIVNREDQSEAKTWQDWRLKND